MLAPSKDRAPLVGRSAEIEALTGLLDDVEHRGAALVLRGDPGIGKSRLLAEAIALAERRRRSAAATMTQRATDGAHHRAQEIRQAFRWTAGAP